jgi:hypothetical protein
VSTSIYAKVKHKLCALVQLEHMIRMPAVSDTQRAAMVSGSRALGIPAGRSASDITRNSWPI